jgi:hypothetical protein
MRRYWHRRIAEELNGRPSSTLSSAFKPADNFSHVSGLKSSGQIFGRQKERDG